MITQEYITTFECGDRSKPVIIFLHGWLGQTISFFKVFKYLENDFHIYSIDMLGFGNSSRPDFLPKDHVEATEYFLQALEKWRIKVGLTKFTLCGHSLGGYI